MGYVRSADSCAEDRSPRPWKTDKTAHGTFWTRMSVEGIVVLLVTSLTVGILTVKMLAGGWENSASPEPTKVVGLRHDAISEAPRSDTSPDVAPAAPDHDVSSQMVVRNGVTVLSPPLLVPVINADALQKGDGSEVLAPSHKASDARKRSHYAHRAQARGQRRVVRSAPFWRVVAR